MMKAKRNTRRNPMAEYLMFLVGTILFAVAVVAAVQAIDG